jgi:hypothetical protein
LDSFKKRHNIVWNGVYGESKDVDESAVSEYKPKLLELISPYEPKNIYNADETGLFFRALPTKSLLNKYAPSSMILMDSISPPQFCIMWKLGQCGKYI